jgi:hypothetical protein
VSLSLDEAVELTRTGDIWLFRGHTAADRAIRITTNSPVNHVGMAVVLDDLPPLLWHAELGRSLTDRWSGTRHRGVQLHDLRDAVLVWSHRYGQRAWLRQFDGEVTRAMEDAVLRTVARLDGTPFPSTARLAGRWLRGRVPDVRGRVPAGLRDRVPAGLRERLPLGRRHAADPGAPETGGADAEEATKLETAYCAEVVAATYDAMGLLANGRPPAWYDPGRFWSGDELKLTGAARLAGEIEVEVPGLVRG